MPPLREVVTSELRRADGGASPRNDCSPKSHHVFSKSHEYAMPAGIDPPLVRTLTAFILKYCASETTLSTCLPAVSGTPALPTHWNVSQAPVFGTLVEPLTLTPSTSRWNVGCVT